jgi:hypothetical protein
MRLFQEYKMADKKVLYNKIRPKLHVGLGVVALLSAVATLVLSPIGQKALKKDDSSQAKPSTPPIVVSTTTKPASTQPATQTATYADEHKVEATKPKKKTKNYTLFIYEKVFIWAEDKGVTTIYAKSDKDANMTITPMKGMSYKALCDSTKTYASPVSKYQKINSKNLCSVFQTKQAGIVTTIYCIDDGKGSSIEIKYQYPSANEKIKKDFNILLSMFKVL